MKCPNDETTLAMTERQGIEIDYCPTCRGVWLDRGELDKLIATGGRIEEKSHPGAHERTERNYDNSHDHRDDRQHYGYGKKHKRESFLGELFDF